MTAPIYAMEDKKSQKPPISNPTKNNTTPYKPYKNDEPATPPSLPIDSTFCAWVYFLGLYNQQ